MKQSYQEETIKFFFSKKFFYYQSLQISICSKYVIFLLDTSQIWQFFLFCESSVFWII
jgi:hypothetical protein